MIREGSQGPPRPPWADHPSPLGARGPLLFQLAFLELGELCSKFLETLLLIEFPECLLAALHLQGSPRLLGKCQESEPLPCEGAPWNSFL